MNETTVTKERMVLSTSDEAATYRTNLSGWVARGGQFWGDDEHMARWVGATHVPCSECGQPTQKGWTKCESCRERADIAKYNARERRAWDGEFLYSDAAQRYFNDQDDLRDFFDDPDCGYTIETLRLLLCEPVYPREIDPDDYFQDDLPEDATLRDVAGELDEWIAKVNECILRMRKSGRPLSWRPGKYAVDLASLPSDLQPAVAGDGRNVKR